MGKYFGTDGIRGVVNETLDAELAFKTGCAAAAVLWELGGKRPRVIIGKDTRISGDMLESALAAGLCSRGADVSLLGVLPTPAVAYLTTRPGIDMGVVISASHNPFEHNGIKIFGTNGYKLSDMLEEKIERYIDGGTDTAKKQNGDLGRITRDHERAADEYIKLLASKAEGHYSGRIAIDCANGASSATARALFTELGADFEIISDNPDGVNINDKCGSTYIEALCEKVRAGGFDIGFSFDGDADRCLASDERGGVVDGDMLLAVLSRSMQAAGTLKGGGIVGTIMSNSGMDVFTQKNDLSFFRADVGDKNVLDMMRNTGCNLGGEASGHMIFSDDVTTGDGQLTAIKLLNAVVSSGKTLSELTGDIPRFPQAMLNHKLSGGNDEKAAIMAHPKLAEEIYRQETLLAGKGRVLIRPSGTEAVIRVLVEADSEESSVRIATELINLMKSL